MGEVRDRFVSSGRRCGPTAGSRMLSAGYSTLTASRRMNAQPHAELAARINAAFEERASLLPGKAPQDVISTVQAAIDLLDSGRARVAEKSGGRWIVHEWLKKAVLLSFRLFDNVPIDAGYTRFF